MGYELPHILKKYFGHDAFRPLQQDIIQAVLDKKDVLALMPTGGGKSLCYQIPTLAQNGLCLVISPLVALMKDQVEALRKRGITAFSLYAGMTGKEVQNTLKVTSESNCKFLFVSPERLETRIFRESLLSLPICLIAVDEAHCISQWGYDFRPPYLRIASLREDLPGIPLLALTATATRPVQQDICDKLLFNKPAIFRQSFERPNLSFSAFEVDDKINKIKEILQNVEGSSIVYCRTRQRTEELSKVLISSGWSAGFYHAGMDRDHRNAVQESWIQGLTRVIVCTNAFGMGIDKPDVRTVIHAEVPDSLENYYQEAGRAGRDGRKAYAILLYNSKELGDLERLPDIQFPAIERIRSVYQSLMNYLQIPAGSGAGNYYDFDIRDFARKFQHDLPLVVNAIKALGQEELLTLSERVFLPSKAIFMANRSVLTEYEKEHPVQGDVINILLRTYGGILDQPVSIQEKRIAYLLKREPAEIIQELHQLHRSGILQYSPQKDTPQLFFIQNRVDSENLYIHPVNYKNRKEYCASRISRLLHFVRMSGECRSRYIANYFGDDQANPCGICDNCLRMKKQERN